MINYGNSDMTDLEKLQSTIAQDPEILDVIDVAHEWWVSWRDQQWVVRDAGADPTAKSFVKGRLASDNPVIYATGLMCLAMSLYRIRPGLDDTHLNLSAPPMVLFDRIVTAVDQVVLTRQQKDSTTILLALQRAKTHAEGDQLRKSWLRVRHAILLSQHLDFANDLEIASDELMHRQRWIGGIYEMDHFMSLVLGFPHARDQNFTDRLAKQTLARGNVDITIKMRGLRRILAITAGKINARNAAATENDKSITSEIQHDLTHHGSMMPLEWWDLNSQLLREDARQTHEHLMTQLWYYQVLAFLHLPDMLDRTYIERHVSRELCLQACRSMLKVFCVLRGTPALSVYICSCEDFQGVVTATILLLGILMGISEEVYPNIESLENDLSILEEVKDIFRYRATMQGGSISRQGLKVVETLESFLTEDSDTPKRSDEDKSRAVIVPYFGLVQIESQVAPLKAAHERMEQLDLATSNNHVDHLYKDTGTSQPSNSTSHIGSDPYASNWASSIEHESPPFTASGMPSEQSPSDFSAGHPDDIFDKPLAAELQVSDLNLTVADPGDLVNWDQFLQGDELGQSWTDVSGWDATFAAWNEDVLSHQPMPGF
jgi:hypothetical protein